MRAPDFWRRGGGPAGVLLAPLGWCYGLATRFRRMAATPWRAPVPIVCVGNVVAGGAGKTPVALDLGRRLARRGKTVHFLGRGYGGAEPGPLRVDPGRHGATQVGDEALLLALAAPTWIARDRVAGVGVAAEGGDVVILDDGFQDPAVAKDLSLVVVDGGFGFGNGHMIPAGPLRESLGAALARADAVVVVGADTAGAGDHIRRLRPGLTVLGAAIRPGPEIDALKARPVVAFAGIGRPEKFFAMLEASGVAIAAREAFADHHAYGAADVERLRDIAADKGAVLVTTEKDAVRLPADLRADVRALSITLDWDDPTAPDRLLAGLFDG